MESRVTLTSNDLLTVADLNVAVDKIWNIDGKIDKIDHTIFGKTSKTYALDLTLNFDPDRMGRKVKPEDIGINLPGLKMLGLDGCIGQGSHRQPGLADVDQIFWAVGNHLGHAHICEHDPDYGTVCTNEKWLRNSDGTYSDLLLHEMAHICSSSEKIYKTKDCSTGYGTHLWIVNSVEVAATTDFGHGESWKKWAIRFGIEPVPWGYPPKVASSNG